MSKYIVWGIPVAILAAIVISFAVGASGVGIGIIVVLFVVVVMISSIMKNVQKVRGHNRCAQCKKRLKYNGGDYAPVCSHCGSRQPWAAAA